MTQVTRESRGHKPYPVHLSICRNGNCLFFRFSDFDESNSFKRNGFEKSCCYDGRLIFGDVGIIGQDTWFTDGIGINEILASFLGKIDFLWTWDQAIGGKLVIVGIIGLKFVQIWSDICIGFWSGGINLGGRRYTWSCLAFQVVVAPATWRRIAFTKIVNLDACSCVGSQWGYLQLLKQYPLMWYLVHIPFGRRWTSSGQPKTSLKILFDPIGLNYVPWPGGGRMGPNKRLQKLRLIWKMWCFTKYQPIFSFILTSRLTFICYLLRSTSIPLVLSNHGEHMTHLV